MATSLTLGAVWLGWQVSQIRRQRLAIERIEESGGTVGVRRNTDESIDGWNKPSSNAARSPDERSQ